MQSTMRIKVEKLKLFQDLVKQFNFRFLSNPMIFKDYAHVHIDGDHLDMSVCNEFFAAWYRFNSEIKEIPEKTKFQKMVRKIKRLF